MDSSGDKNGEKESNGIETFRDKSGASAASIGVVIVTITIHLYLSTTTTATSLHFPTHPSQTSNET